MRVARRRGSEDPATTGPRDRPARTTGHLASLRVESWPNDPTVGHLVIVDHRRTPGPDDLEAARARAIAAGYRALRTSAMFPDTADAVLQAGYTTVDRLVLLRLDLTTGTALTPGAAQRVATASIVPRHRVRRLPRRSDRAAARIDRLAFGPTWGNDVAGIRAVRRATPVHRARGVGVGDLVGIGDLVGFAITGVAGTSGYLQRLAVHPDHRRRGIADALVTDALDRLRRHHVREVLVNTGVTNEAARALYDRYGFVGVGHDLIVAELDLTRTRFAR